MSPIIIWWSNTTGYVIILFWSDINTECCSKKKVVVIDNQILLKPRDENDAFGMLQKLSGRTHQVYTGVAICNSKETVSFTDCAYVTFDKISDTEIYDYISSGEPMDKAGAYAVQGIGCKFIKEIKGDYYTVMGLPSNKVYRALEGMKFCNVY